MSSMKVPEFWLKRCVKFEFKKVKIAVGVGYASREDEYRVKKKCILE